MILIFGSFWKYQLEISSCFQLILSETICHMSSVFMIHFSLCHSTGDYITVVIVIVHRHISKTCVCLFNISSNFRYRFTQPREPMKEWETARNVFSCNYHLIPLFPHSESLLTFWWILQLIRIAIFHRLVAVYV